MEPDKWTFAEIWRMVQIRVRYDWAHTSALLATILNVNRVGGNAVTFDAFVPKTEEEREAERVEKEKTPENQAAKEEFLNYLRRNYRQGNGNRS